MPNPMPGQGAIVGTIGQVVPIGTLYLAAYSASATVAAPGHNLGNTEPPGAFVRMGLLRDDTFDVNETDPTKLEYRRGFHRIYQGEVIRQAGMRTIVAQMDEVENAVLARFTGDTPTVLGSPSDSKMDLGPSELYHFTLLAVYFEALSGIEFHIYSPHALGSYKMSKNAEFWTVTLNLTLIPFLNASNRYKDLTRFEFPAQS